MQRIVPYLTYTDAPTSVGWLIEAFGFAEVLRYVEKDGCLSHAELTLDGESVFLCSAATEHHDEASPARDREGRRWIFAQRIREVASHEWGAITPRSGR
jgi:hypothetical protein